ncbi:MAG: hypothetical protein GWP10_13410 [Nitrospiraceae bacterium]|nr:hypothetical protein [Nitrospiraceae bacterium]
MGTYGDDDNYIKDLYYENDSDYGTKYYKKYCRKCNQSELLPMLTVSKNMATIMNNLWNPIDIVENNKC